MQINKRPRITNLQHLRVKVRTFNIQKQKPSTLKSKSKNLQHPKTKVRLSTSKTKSKNFEHPRTRVITFNIKKKK
jgi:hypothetical protein